MDAGISPKMSSVFPNSSSSVLPLVFFFVDFFFFGSAAPSSANMSPSCLSLGADVGAGGGTWEYGMKKRFKVYLCVSGLSLSFSLSSSPQHTPSRA